MVGNPMKTEDFLAQMLRAALITWVVMLCLGIFIGALALIAGLVVAGASAIAPLIPW